jgi:hypothetical protein
MSVWDNVRGAFRNSARPSSRGGINYSPVDDDVVIETDDADDDVAIMTKYAKRKEHKNTVPTLAFHSAWIYLSLMLMLFFAFGFYIPWGMRQESDEPLYGMMDYTLNGDRKWHHKWGATMILPIGLGLLAALGLFNFLIPNKGLKWGCFGRDASGPADYTFFNHIEIWITGIHVSVFYFLVLLMLGMTDLNTLVFGSLLAFASEAIFSLALYITHFEDKYQIQSAAAARATWLYVRESLEEVRKKNKHGTAIKDMEDDELCALLLQWKGPMEGLAATYLGRYEAGKVTEPAFRAAWKLGEDTTIAADAMPMIKKYYPKSDRDVDAKATTVQPYAGDRKSGKGKISGTFAGIAAASRIAIWTLAWYAFAYTQRDFSNSQYASGVLMLTFDLFLVAKHIFCLCYAMCKEPVGYYRSHGPTLLILGLMSIGLSVPLVLSFYHEGSIPGAL